MPKPGLDFSELVVGALYAQAAALAPVVEAQRPASRKVKYKRLWTPTKCLRWLLRFARNRRADDPALPREIEAFVRSARAQPGSILPPVKISQADIEKLQAHAHHALREIASNREWGISVSELPTASLSVTARRPSYSANLADSFLLAIRDFFSRPGGRTLDVCRRPPLPPSHPDEGERLCARLFLRERHKAYCSPQCSRLAEAARARARRLRTPQQQRNDRRHQAYKNSLPPNTRSLVARRKERVPKPEADQTAPTPELSRRSHVAKLSQWEHTVLLALAASPHYQATIAELRPRIRRGPIKRALGALAKKGLATCAADGQWLALVQPKPSDSQGLA